jgi:Na+/melibiose symporter-like transporter
MEKYFETWGSSIEGIIATVSVVATLSSLLFSARNLFRLEAKKDDINLKEITNSGDSNIVYNSNKREISIKDKNEVIENDEILIEKIKPTEVYISNHYSNNSDIDVGLGKNILSNTALNFENEHLSNYYRQTLLQSQISFWFSLIFASLGFLLIILASVSHATNSLDKTVISIISGVVIDAISALFFVQSNNAKKAVTTFFEKLRKDKQIHDAIKICESIEDIKIKDKLKVNLSLSLLGLANSNELTKELTETT